jgi:hypothetical protein
VTVARVRDDLGRELDATFSVEQHEGYLALVIESKGGARGSPEARNVDYNEGLELLLRRLGAAGAQLVDALLDTAHTAHLAVEKRRLLPDGYAYPVDLASTDAAQLRRSLSSAQTRTGRDPTRQKGGGNPTKRVRFIIAPSAPQEPEEMAAFLAGPGRRHWALCANPTTYRINDAVRELLIDWWTTAGKKLAPGDRVAIWKTKDKAGNRGVVALGEVVGEREIRADTDNVYWVAGAGRDEDLERVPIRYVVPPHLPLWLDKEDTDGMLNQLSVAKARGGTVFNLTAEQWEALAKAAGGWPSPEGAELAELMALGWAGRGQGRRMSPAARKAIELYAMDQAKAHYAPTWVEVLDVSAQASYDLLCRRPGEELRVEVKGTTDDGSSVLLTRNEVERARKHFPHVALFVVANIECDDAGTLDAAHARIFIYEPWWIGAHDLVAVGYECYLATTPSGVLPVMVGEKK